MDLVRANGPKSAPRGNTVEDVDEATVAVANSAMPDGAGRQVYAPITNSVTRARARDAIR